MRRIVFFGNCQAHRISVVYQTAFASKRGDIVDYVSCYAAPQTEAEAAALAAADLVVAQVFDAQQKIDFDASSSSAEVLLFPTLTAGFLWPYGGVSHIHNKPLPHFACGPYDMLMGDNFLNRQIMQGATPAAAAAAYADLDIARKIDLDRLREIVMDQQRTREAKCGTRFSDEIDRYFRSEHVFLNHYHPNLRIAATYIGEIIYRIGVGRSEIDRVIGRWTRTPFEKFALPIHPSVVRHFGLSFVEPAHRYLYHTGEMLTFDEFAAQYVAYDWNDDLLRGFADAFSGTASLDPVESATRLAAALRRSKGSAGGERALAALLSRAGAEDDALAALRRSVALDPFDPDTRHDLGHLLRRLDDALAAEAAFRRAVELDPASVSFAMSLAELLVSQRRRDEALTVLGEAAQMEPGNVELIAMRAQYGELASS